MHALQVFNACRHHDYICIKHQAIVKRHSLEQKWFMIPLYLYSENARLE